MNISSEKLIEQLDKIREDKEAKMSNFALTSFAEWNKTRGEIEILHYLCYLLADVPDHLRAKG